MYAARVCRIHSQISISGGDSYFSVCVQMPGYCNEAAISMNVHKRNAAKNQKNHLSSSLHRV